MTSRVSVLVYGDVNMNIIDGSSVWTQSVCLALASTLRADVNLLLKVPAQNDRLLAPLNSHPKVNVIDPSAAGLLGNGARELSRQQVIEAVKDQVEWDRLLVRGSDIALALAKEDSIAGRLWTYLTDIPQNALDVTVFLEDRLETIGRASEVVFSQTEELRSFLEAAFPSVAGKCWLLPPMIPDGIEPETGTTPSKEDLRLVYSGKFAAAWNTFEMSRLPSRLQDRGVNAKLTVVGDKFNKDPNDAGYIPRMREALETSKGVDWIGGIGRADSLEVTSRAHVGLGWRAESMSDSLELSTKLLEYCAVGSPPLANRTPMHERLLGKDYPLFADSEEEVLAVLEDVASEASTYRRALETTRQVANNYTISEGARRLDSVIDAHLPLPLHSSGTSRVLVMSHDLKFFAPLQSYLAAMPDVELNVDHWPALDRHDPEASLQKMRAAETIICEWCGPNAAFASANKRAGQKLIIRLHRFELYSGYWRHVDIDAVDMVVTVSPHYRDLTLEATKWPEEKVVSIPNYVDVGQLDRPKMRDARFHVGMIGIAPSRKRMDLAFEVMRELRMLDPRFMLFIKSKLPWDYPWIWDLSSEKEYYSDAFRMLQDPLLDQAVVFDGFGPDVPGWLRKIGFVLSTSDDESFHLAPAEGMGSGAVPVVRDWPGADTIYDPRWIQDVDEMANRIATIGLRQDLWRSEGELAKAQVRVLFDIGSVHDLWRGILATA